MDFNSLILAFLAVSASEMGDKTQLAILVLSARGSSLTVFLGAFAALAAMSGLTLVLGATIASAISAYHVAKVAGLAFIASGLVSFIKREEGEPRALGRLLVWSTFLLVALAEFGDKTQLAILGLAWSLGSYDAVLLGSLAAFALTTILAVSLGVVLAKRLPMKWIRISTSILFLIIGLAYLLG